MFIGEKIAALRKKKDITQTELAKRINISRSVMNRIELGTRAIRDDELKSIAIALEISTDYLLGNDTAPQNLILPAFRAAKDDIQLSDNEKLLINMYRALDESAKTRVLRNLKGEYDDKKQSDEKVNKDA